MRNRRSLVTLASLFVFSMPCLAQSGPAGDGHPPYAPDPIVRAGLSPVNATNERVSRDFSHIMSPLDEQVWTLEARVNAVRQEWLISDKQDAAVRRAIKQSALREGQALATISDGQLGLGGLIVKYEYACFAFVMVAANGTSKQEDLSFANTAEGYCRSASSRLKEAMNRSSMDRNAKAVLEWASKSAEQPRIRYLLAMSKCLQATATGSEKLNAEATKIISSEIPADYLDLYPPGRDVVLSRCVAPRPKP